MKTEFQLSNELTHAEAKDVAEFESVGFEKEFALALVVSRRNVATKADFRRLADSINRLEDATKMLLATTIESRNTGLRVVQKYSNAL